MPNDSPQPEERSRCLLILEATLIAVNLGFGQTDVEILVISRSAWREVVEECRARVPNEACGLLGGRLTADGQRAELAKPVTNISASPVYYEMDPLGMLAAIDALEAAGLEEVAYFHSHPASEPNPSATDIAKARVGFSRMLIVSLKDPSRPRATFHLLGEGKAIPGQLIVED